jgi:tetratricopeptide (TPR) repeat protein
MTSKTALVLCCALLLSAFCWPVSAQVPEEAKSLFAAGDYPQAIEVLNRAAASAPGDAALDALLARCYFESEQFDRAIAAAEKAVNLDPKNSAYHELLGHSYGEKASRSGWFSALSLAKKARKEFATAVELDERNFSAMQALIEYDCSAPGVAGGGEDKAAPEMAKLAGLDTAEGLYASANCKRQKKDYQFADAGFERSLRQHPQSADLIYDIGDYYMKRGQADRLLLVVAEGERADPKDPRGPFYRAVAYTIQQDKAGEAAKLLREYVAHAAKRDNYPSRAMAHYWLGRIGENQNDAASAKREYREAVNLEPKNRFANEALKRLQAD